MQRVVVALALVGALAAGAGQAGAASEHAADRACLGTFVSDLAQAVRPLGAGVREEAGPAFGEQVRGEARCEFA